MHEIEARSLWLITPKVQLQMDQGFQQKKKKNNAQNLLEEKLRNTCPYINVYVQIRIF